MGLSDYRRVCAGDHEILRAYRGTVQLYDNGRVTVAPPASLTPPVVSGQPVVGATLTLAPGTWSGAPASYAVSWLRDDVPIEGAMAMSYVPVAADDGRIIRAEMRASNAGGDSPWTDATGGGRAAWPAPVATGGPGAQELVLNSGVQNVNVQSYFTDAAGGAWSVAGAEATIISGIVSLATDTARAAEPVTASYTNSGGAAGVTFSVTIAAEVVPAADAPATDGTGTDGPAA